jgi:hypothetical protein
MERKTEQALEYTKPQIADYGSIQEITATGGADVTDVPIGTPNTGPGSVTGPSTP